MKSRLPFWMIAAAAVFSACSYIRFSPPQSSREIALKQEILSFYDQGQQAFLAKNPDSLALLFLPSISNPVSREDIRRWAMDFFSRNPTASLTIDNIAIVNWGYEQALVDVSYTIKTPAAAEDITGTDQEVLVKRGNNWFISEWQKLK